MARAAANNRPAVMLALLSALALASVVGFMTIGARGDWSFVLAFRGAKLAGLVLVAAAVAIATVLFQAVMQNRILTPAVIGFDSLYVAIQTGLVFLLGAHAAASLDPQLAFALKAGLMMLAALGLLRGLLDGSGRDLHLLMLCGIVFGIFCRSFANLLQRLLDPNSFANLQDTLFARFNTVETSLLPVAGAAVLAAAGVAWRLAPALDVLALGRERAISLGIDHRRLTTALLALVAALVSVSTALVGPVLFFGLLVSNLACHLVGSDRHRHVLPCAVLLAVICLVGGQTLLERAFGLDTALGVIVEFVGGIVFIVLMVKGGRP